MYGHRCSRCRSRCGIANCRGNGRGNGSVNRSGCNGLHHRNSCHGCCGHRGCCNKAGIGYRRSLIGFLRNGKLDGLRGGLGAQVVHTRLQALLPGVEVHGRQFAHVGGFHKQVERLGLVNKQSAIRSHVDDVAHGNLPNRLVQFLDVGRNGIDVLDGTVAGHDGIFHLLVPKTELNQVQQEVLVHHNKLARQNASGVDVGGIRLEALVVAQNLAGRGRRHRSHQKGVPNAVLANFCTQGLPVPTAAQAVFANAPHIELELALADGRPFVRLVFAFCFGHVAAGFQGCKVDGFKNVLVQGTCLFGREGVTQHDKGIGQSLNAQAHRTVAHVGVARFGYRVVIAVNNLVQVLGHLVGDVVQHLVVELSVLHKTRQGDRGQVAYRHLVGRGVLHDLRAQVGGANDAQVLLVALGVAGVLVQHVRSTGLNLGFQNLLPQLAGFDGLAALSFGLVAVVECLKLGSVGVKKTGAFVGAHEGPG